MSNKLFKKIAAEVKTSIEHGVIRVSANEKDAEWQRVNTSISDVLKSSSELFYKLTRLQSDFIGVELDKLSEISQAVLVIGNELSQFSKAFYDGQISMTQTTTAYGSDGQPLQQNMPNMPDVSDVFQPGGESAEHSESGEGEELSDESDEEESGEGEEQSDDEDEDYSGKEE